MNHKPWPQLLKRWIALYYPPDKSLSAEKCSWFLYTRVHPLDSDLPEG